MKRIELKEIRLYEIEHLWRSHTELRFHSSECEYSPLNNVFMILLDIE